MSLHLVRISNQYGVKLVKQMCAILYLVVPCYNEQEVLPVTAEKLTDKMESLIQSSFISDQSRIIFVDDGSKDTTWQVINEQHDKNHLVQGYKLSRNKGHQNALLAGLLKAKEKADIIISLDADLQDDIDAIDKFVEKYYEGYDIVYGVRQSRKSDTIFKRGTAQAFYKLMHHMGVDIVYNHADYRMMSKRAVEALSQYEEVNLFLRGMVPLIGYKSTSVFYERSERFAGESKYPLRKMISFAFDGITSFSIKPIRMIAFVGLFVSIASMFLILYIFISSFFNITVTGWNSIVCSLWLLGGLQLLAIGVVGEYIGKIYLEVKHRPKFFVDEYLE